MSRHITAVHCFVAIRPFNVSLGHHVSRKEPSEVVRTKHSMIFRVSDVISVAISLEFSAVYSLFFMLFFSAGCTREPTALTL